MYKIIFDDRDGFTYISNNGIAYDLSEGFSLGGESTTDICFVTLSSVDYSGNSFVGYMYGAAFLKDALSKKITGLEDELTEANMAPLHKMIANYEASHPEILELLRKEN